VGKFGGGKESERDRTGTSKGTHRYPFVLPATGSAADMTTNSVKDEQQAPY